MGIGLSTNDATAGWWGDSSSYNTDTSEGVAASDIATVNAAPVSGGDSWTDWFKTTASGLLDYSIKKDAALTGAQLGYRGTTTPQNVPVYTRAAAAPVLSGNMVLLIAGIAYLALKK